MCVISGKVDYIVQAMDDEIKKIVCMITELDDLAYATYKPIVEEICARKAYESEVEYLLDYMVGICSSDRMLELFKCVCRKYIYIYIQKWLHLKYIHIRVCMKKQEMI